MDLTQVAVELADKQQALQARIEGLSRPVDPDATIGFGKRIGDGTSEAITRMEDASSAQAINQTLEQVRRARQKLEQGSYGSCDVCSGPIGEARLEFRPWSTTCVTHADQATSR